MAANEYNHGPPEMVAGPWQLYSSRISNQGQPEYSSANNFDKPYKQAAITTSTPLQSQHITHTPVQYHSQPTTTDTSTIIREHLAGLPMFPMQTHHEATAVQEMRYHATTIYNMQEAEPQLNAGEKVMMNLVMGGDFINPVKGRNTALKVASGAIAMTTTSVHAIKSTRWALVPSSRAREVIIVDSIEWRGPLGNSKILLKFNATGDMLKFSLLGKDSVMLQRGKIWKKSWTFKVLDALAVEIDGRQIPMEVLAQQSHPVAPAEVASIMKRFEFAWEVPQLDY